MSYHGYTNYAIKHINSITVPRVLEVGVDRGVMFFSVLHSLILRKQNFMMVGVDVMIQEQVKLMTSMFERAPQHQVYLFEENSLEIMPKMVEQGLTFDLILLDGDHNYHTVRQELESVDLLLNHRGICIVDDYNGRWSDKDLWYSQRPEYVGNQRASAPVETDKKGVRPAVDEFISLRPSWSTEMPIVGEPIVLIKG